MLDKCIDDAEKSRASTLRAIHMMSGDHEVSILPSSLIYDVLSISSLSHTL